MTYYRYIILPIIILLFAFSSCKKNPTNNNNDDIIIPFEMPQTNIDWPSLAGSPWPMYRHDPQGTGRSQYQGPQVGHLKWKYGSNSPIASGNGFTSSAIGPDGTIYTFSSYEHTAGYTQQWEVYAINPSDGSLKWSWTDSLNHDGEIERSPLITSDSTIVVCARGLAPNNYIYALNPNNTLKWKYNTKGQPSDPNIGVDGTIFFTTTEGLFAITSEGTLKWELIASNDFNPYPPSGLAISADGQILYIGGYEGHSIHAVSKNGDLLWSYPEDNSGNKVSHMPMVDNQNNVYIITLEGLTSLSSNGDVRWKYECQSHTEKMVMDTNGQIYIHNTNDPHHELMSLNYAGQEQWSIDVKYTISGLVIDSNGIVYILGTNDVSAVSTDNRSLIWELSLGYNYQSWYTPALDDGALYFGIAAGSNNKFLYSIE